MAPVQQCMLDILSDGQYHTARELHACLYDSLSPVRNIRYHLTLIRRALRPRGRGIICERLNGQTRYRLVSFAASEC